MAVIDLLQNKNAKEQANIKGKEIAKIGSVSKTKVKDYEIEITEFKPIEGGVEFLARAWTKNKQIGFGKDGSVDLERFVFVNPPILVPDLNGNIVREWVDGDGKPQQRRLREDLEEAILQSLSHTIKVKKQKFGSEKIIKGKIGNTTLTAYPNIGSGTPPNDGRASREVVSETFATIHDGAGTSSSDTGINEEIRLRSSDTTDEYVSIKRVSWGFDTSSIGTDGIDSAILSIDGSGTNTALGTTDVDIVESSPADEGNIANSDYGNFGTTRFATGIAIASWGTSYNNFTLNASGETHINKSGNTIFGGRLKWDVDNSFTGVWAGESQTAVSAIMADKAGTSEDPKLVVEHSAVALEINVDDDISATESIVKELNSFINKVDSVSITENISSNATIGGIIVDDDVNITEDIAMLFVNLINVFDSVSITEDITLTNTELGGIDIDDDINATENIVSVASMGGIIIDDDIAISENISMLLASFISVSDSISITEDIISNATIGGIIVDDDINVGESTTVENLILGGINISDNIEISEDITSVASMANISVTDSISASEDIVITNTELGGISVDDDINISESIAMSVDNFISVTDSISITEDTSILFPFLVVNVVDSISIKEFTQVAIQTVWTDRTEPSSSWTDRDEISEPDWIDRTKQFS